jgi:lysophospholipase L1-like esterase
MVWPHIVTRRIQDQFPNSQFDYINGGVPGYGTRTSLRNLRERISDYSPDVIVIYHGTNDLSHMVDLSLEILLLKDEASTETAKLAVNDERITAPFREDLLELVRAAKSRAPIVALATFSVQYRTDQKPEQQMKAAATSLYVMPYMTIEGLFQSFDAYNAVPIYRRTRRRHTRW